MVCIDDLDQISDHDDWQIPLFNFLMIVEIQAADW